MRLGVEPTYPIRGAFGRRLPRQPSAPC